MSLRLFQSMNKLSHQMGEEEASRIILGKRADAFLQAVRIDNFQTEDQRG